MIMRWVRRKLGLDDVDLDRSREFGRCAAWFMGRFGIPVICGTWTNRQVPDGRWVCRNHEALWKSHLLAGENAPRGAK